MNIPPETREDIIEKILDSSLKLSFCDSSGQIIRHPPLGSTYREAGYTYRDLASMLDYHYENLELALMDLEEYRPYYTAYHPFNQPDAIADFGWWVKKPYWTLDEAVALLFGKDPEIVNWESVSQADVRFVPFVTSYIKITELAERYKNTNVLIDPIEPCLFLDWAKRMQLPIEPALLTEIEKIGAQNKLVLLRLEKEISPNTEKTYLTIIGALLKTFLAKTSSGENVSSFNNQSAIVEYLVNNFSKNRGISKSTLEDKFSKANQALK